jgi:hypothetical protein
MIEGCSKDSLEEFSKKHYTYINQIFGDATVRNIIEEEFPTTYAFEVEETGADFDFSYHHTVKDKDNGHILCSVDDGYQNIYKNKNDTLCQSYSMLTYFDIDIPDDKKEKQMEMIKMYRDILNGHIEGFDNVDFKKIINDEILKVPKNRKLWRNFVTNSGYINMNKTKLFQNIEDTLDEWEKFGYWYFIGKGDCPKHEKYSSEMASQYNYSRDLSNERDEGYYMEHEDVKIKSAPKSASRKSSSSKSASRKRSGSKSAPNAVSIRKRSGSKSAPKSASKAVSIRKRSGSKSSSRKRSSSKSITIEPIKKTPSSN